MAENQLAELNLGSLVEPRKHNMCIYDPTAKVVFLPRNGIDSIGCYCMKYERFF